MSTRSLIGYFDPNTPEIRMVYCHWDGYPEHNGKVLLNNYDYFNVTDLLDVCEYNNHYISVLGNSESECEFGNDFEIQSFSNLDELYDYLDDSWCEFAYIKAPDGSVAYVDQHNAPRKLKDLAEYFASTAEAEQ